MAEEQRRTSPPLTGALAALGSDAARLIEEVIEQRDPDLHRRLRTRPDVVRADRVAVERLLADELTWGPDWEPTARGREVDDALGWFLQRFPIEREHDPERDS